jgi:hypothetical protein
LSLHLPFHHIAHSEQQSRLFLSVGVGFLVPADLFVVWCQLIHFTFRIFLMQSYGRNVVKCSAENTESCAESSKMADSDEFQTFFLCFLANRLTVFKPFIDFGLDIRWV